MKTRRKKVIAKTQGIAWEFHPVYHHDKRIQTMIMGAKEDIKRMGFHMVYVHDPRGTIPVFAYTIGLTLKRCLEVLVYGLPGNTSLDVLTTVYHRMLEKAYKPGRMDYVRIFEDRLANFKIIHPSQIPAHFQFGKYVLEAVYERKMTARPYQLFWTDKDGYFPWDSNCDPEIVRFQPLLYEEKK